MTDYDKVPFFQRIIDAVVGFINCLALRIIATFAIGLILVVFVSDTFYPKMRVSQANNLVVSLAAEAKEKIPPATDIVHTVRKYNLAWYYVTTIDGKLENATKPFAPDLGKYDISPRELDWKKQHFYEAVSQLNPKQLLHIGVYAGPYILPNLGEGEAIANRHIPLGYAGFVFLGLMVATLMSMQMAVGQPLNNLARACYSLLLARDAYSHVTGGALTTPGAVTEVKNIGKGMKDIRRQYDEATLAKTAKEHELVRQRSEFEEEKSIINRQHEDERKQMKAQLTELETKEAEEEFLNQLGKELDNLKSTNQIYHRVLEKLNDKYPTSFIYGAFIAMDKLMQKSDVVASLGFDDKGRNILEKMEHGRIARQIFGTGQSLSISANNLRDYGLQQLSQHASVRHVIYLPLRFQGRDLGILAFYFVQEGAVVQNRLRILRNVADQVSRALFQSVIYEEELEASRTDPLTGLRNKKYFNEMVPKIFERAKANPQQNPISFIVIDGDKFKSINDTYGHQTGDAMLKALSDVLRQCVRVHDTLQQLTDKGDCLVRYGGEEFVVVLEGTDAKQAMQVAERIRTSIESKTDWPGGIPKWTVSLGIAAFPNDGRNIAELFEKADIALYYVKEELGRNKSCLASSVPKSFAGKKKVAMIQGELGVFDPITTIQNFANSMKTGMLTVTQKDGKQFWMSFASGKPMQARLGKFGGNIAITEYLVTFDDGEFKFQEVPDADKLPKHDDIYNITKGLDRSLMDGALAQDNFEAARVVVSDTEIIIRPIDQITFNEKWNSLGSLPDPPLPDEFSSMAEIVKLADGKRSLEKIFKQLDTIPTHTVYRGAFWLIQQGLVEVLTPQGIKS